MTILIVDNNIHLRHYPQGLMIAACLGLSRCVSVRIRKPHQLTERDLHARHVILSGSTAYIREEKDWMSLERDYLERWMRAGTPVLGICFGAQLIARHLYGPSAITALPYPISGSICFTRKGSSALLAGLPETFGVVATHYEGFTVPAEHCIGSVPEWPSYAFRYNEKTYGVQFHPELNGVVGARLVKLQRFLYDRHVYQEFTVPTSPQHSRKLFGNFLALRSN